VFNDYGETCKFCKFTLINRNHCSQCNENDNECIVAADDADRYVLLGNHRDAWVFGAVDPTSGTALMMEVSRVLAHLVTKEGNEHE